MTVGFVRGAELRDWALAKFPARDNGQWVNMPCPLPGHTDNDIQAGVNVESGMFKCHGQHGTMPLSQLCSSLDIPDPTVPPTSGRTARRMPKHPGRDPDHVHSYDGSQRKLRWDHTDSERKDFGRTKSIAWYHGSGTSWREWKSGRGCESGTPWGLLNPQAVLNALDAELPVVIVEGETNADAVTRETGIAATTSSGGSSTIGLPYDVFPVGSRQIYVLADNDDPGRKLQRAWTTGLLDRDCEVKQMSLTWKDEPAIGADIVDWFAEGNGATEFSAAMEAAESAIAEGRPGTDSVGLGAVLLTLSDVEPQSISWLWEGCVPADRFMMLVADPGTGKSLVACDITARITTGAAWPDGQPGGAPADVVILAAEDSPGDYRIRLDAAGADVSRCHVLESVLQDGDRREVTLADVPAVRDAVEQLRSKGRNVPLIILDTVGALMASGVDDSNNSDVRVMLRPLAALAAELKTTIMAIHHLRKSGGTGLHRVLGSIGWAAAARAILGVARDPDAKRRRLLLTLKSNYSAEQLEGALAFDIEPDAHGRPRLLWQESRIDIDPDEAMSPDLSNPTRVGVAEEFLQESLADGPLAKKELLSTAKSEGIVTNARTLERASRSAPASSRSCTTAAFSLLPAASIRCVSPFLACASRLAPASSSSCTRSAAAWAVARWRQRSTTSRL